MTPMHGLLKEFVNNNKNNEGERVGMTENSYFINHIKSQREDPPGEEEVINLARVRSSGSKGSRN